MRHPSANLPRCSRRPSSDSTALLRGTIHVDNGGNVPSDSLAVKRTGLKSNIRSIFSFPEFRNEKTGIHRNLPNRNFSTTNPRSSEEFVNFPLRFLRPCLRKDTADTLEGKLAFAMSVLVIEVPACCFPQNSSNGKTLGKSRSFPKKESATFPLQASQVSLQTASKKSSGFAKSYNRCERH